MVAFIVEGWSDEEHRVRDIWVKNIECSNCYYGVSLINNGDSTRFDRIFTDNVLRSYFIYGVKDQRANIESFNGGEATADILINRYEYDTENIKVFYKSRKTRNKVALVRLNIQPYAGSPPGKIQDVELILDVDVATTAVPVLFSSYVNGATPIRITGLTENKFNNISIGGSVKSSTRKEIISSEVRPKDRGTLKISRHLKYDPSVGQNYLIKELQE
jgi:hypothetical protein